MYIGINKLINKSRFILTINAISGLKTGLMKQALALSAKHRVIDLEGENLLLDLAYFAINAFLQTNYTLLNMLQQNIIISLSQFDEGIIEYPDQLVQTEQIDFED